MKINNKVCFFSTVPKEKLIEEHYSMMDIRILKELGYNVHICNQFADIPYGCHFYFSWWASGSILPLIKAKISNRPIITIAGGNEALLHRDSLTNEPLGYLASPIYKKISTLLTLRFSTKLLVVSEFMKKGVAALGAKNPIVVYNCVDTELFKPNYDSPKDFITTVVNCNKGVFENKRLEVMLRAMSVVLKKFPNVKFAVIGNRGNAYDRIVAVVNGLQIQNDVFFTGKMPNESVVEILNKTKIYIQISDTETFGLAMAEAMSCGIPVVVSKRGAIPEIAGPDAYYVNHNDPDSVAQCINEILLKNTNELMVTGNNLRKRIVDNFSYQHRLLAISNIIKDMIPFKKVTHNE